MSEVEELEQRVMECGWAELVPHHARGALLLVSQGLDLIEAALAIARDDPSAVAGLLDSGSLDKVDDEIAEHYQQQADVRFRFVILQPYVLAQEL